MRDRFHHFMDESNGDIDKLQLTQDNDLSVIQLYEQLPSRVHTPTSVATADWVLEQEGISLPGQ